MTPNMLSSRKICSFINITDKDSVLPTVYSCGKGLYSCSEPQTFIFAGYNRSLMQNKIGATRLQLPA
jgi:hypothetical protein